MNLNEILGIKYPIIQGGMANIATGEFAASVSNAGGLGLIATGGYGLDEIRNHIRRARELTDKPFGVNIMMMHPDLEAIAELVVEEGVKILSTGAGSPAKYIPGWKDNGITVMCVTPSVTFARRMESSGADIIVAEGTESGGHVGEMTTMALIPQVCKAVSVPVVAAGGIASGAQMLAAFALGACGVQLGTILLGAQECPIHEGYKEAVLKAKDTDTVVTGRIGGVPVRTIKNKMSREYLKREKEGASREELELFTLGSLKRAVYEGDAVRGSIMAGQVAGMVNEIRPVKEILEGLMRECADVYNKLGGNSLLRESI